MKKTVFKTILSLFFCMALLLSSACAAGAPNAGPTGEPSAETTEKTESLLSTEPPETETTPETAETERETALFPSLSKTGETATSPPEEPSETTAPDESEEGERFTVSFETGVEGLTVAPVKVTAGEAVRAPEAIREGYVLRRWLLDKREYDFSSPVCADLTLRAEWLERTNLPTTVIELKNANGGAFSVNNVTRESYVTSVISVYNEDGSCETRFSSSLFKGRGNGSWGDPKKCFKIKFDEKQPLFGRTANRHWVLLACTNFNDETLLRNYTAYNLAVSVFDALEYVPGAVMTDVYINGEYRGVYVLCEQVRVGNGRVDIESKYGVEDTGFLIEYDAYAEGVEGIDYFSIVEGSSHGGRWGGQRSNGIVKYDFTVHSPDPDDYLTEGKITEQEYRAQVAYIKDYVSRVYKAAIVDHDFETLCELVDIDSLVDIYILQEFYKNTDAGYSSFYMYKKPGGKLYFGPPWDFDGTTVAARGEENNPNGIYVAGTVGRYDNRTASELFAELYKTSGFLTLVKARWKELSPQIKDWFNALFTTEFYEENRYAFGRNFVRWQGGRFGRPGRITQGQAEENWINNCKTLKKWFDGRLAYLDKAWA